MEIKFNLKADVPNKNGTIYPKEELERAIEEYNKKISKKDFSIAKLFKRGISIKERIKCPSCKGEKKLYGIGCPGFKPIEMDCPNCDKNGEIEKEKYEAGQKRKKNRLKRKMTLRKEAQRLGICPAELSQIERGIL